MTHVPSRIRRLETGLLVEWPDGLGRELSSWSLRGACCCARCVSEDTGKRLVGPAQVPADVRWTDVRLIGNYAIGIAFSDGHDTGIYSYRYLRELAEEAAADAASGPSAT